MTTFASWIKLRRRALDLTPDELAAQIGYASLTLEKIERGQHRPSLELAARLAEALAIPAHERQRFLQLAGSELAQRAEPPGAPEPIRPQPAPAAPALVGREAERAALAERSARAMATLSALTLASSGRHRALPAEGEGEGEVPSEGQAEGEGEAPAEGEAAQA